MSAWACLGIPPKTPPCGASGTADKDAGEHTKTTQHSTSSGATRAGVDAVLTHVKESR